MASVEPEDEEPEIENIVEGEQEQNEQGEETEVNPEDDKTEIEE